jgi:hypothetical protein
MGTVLETIEFPFTTKSDAEKEWKKQHTRTYNEYGSGGYNGQISQLPNKITRWISNIFDSSSLAKDYIDYNGEKREDVLACFYHLDKSKNYKAASDKISSLVNSEMDFFIKNIMSEYSHKKYAEYNYWEIIDGPYTEEHKSFTLNSINVKGEQYSVPIIVCFSGILDHHYPDEWEEAIYDYEQSLGDFAIPAKAIEDIEKGIKKIEARIKTTWRNLFSPIINPSFYGVVIGGNVGL